jgi:Domain of unknown function (DUF1906)
MRVSRRELLRLAAAGLTGSAAVAVGGTLATLQTVAHAAPTGPAPLGVLLDYAGGVISAGAIRAAGAAGAIRYVSDPRPGGGLNGKPIKLAEARDLYQNGLKIVSCYQYGKNETADWLGGQPAGVRHAQRGWQLHLAAGGPVGAPVYASIDDDPSFDQYRQQVAPYLRGWESVLGHQRVGVYANSKTIDWALHDGIGSYFWQHNWGSPPGYTHPAAHLHQVEIDKRSVGGVGVDVNHILRAQFGQWD